MCYSLNRPLVLFSALEGQCRYSLMTNKLTATMRIAVPIRNAHTRAAYYRAIQQFLVWVERAGYQNLEDIEPITVAAYIETLQRQAAPPTVKQHMAAIRMLFSWLTEKGVLAMDPAREVKTERFHPGTHQLRKQLSPLADHNRVREHQGAPRQISLSKLFANSIATFAFISARSAHIRRYFWN